MKKVIIMRGLPGSGKSTYAKKLIDEKPNSYKRINRDELRAMLDNGHFSKGNEKFVKKLRDELLIEALKEGKHVIIDDLNLSSKNEARISQLVQEYIKESKENVKVEIVEIDTPVEVCVERDSKREKPVGKKRIRELAHKFYKKELEYRVQDTNLPKAIICDLDGTLSLLNGRDPYIASECDKDKLNEPVANLLKTYKQLGTNIILFSGRYDTYKDKTIAWLDTHGIEYDLLEMRKEGDMRKDAIIKRELFDTFIEGKY
ncbi:AAA family ATPase, partial [Candidatus Kapabacteria bacterium]|nr:AAA family ATPase [Candidatus Kapabacteria bacterium]